MFDKKLTLVALLTLGLVACTQDKPKSDTPETKAPAPAAKTAEAATLVAAAPAAAPAAKAGEAEAGSSCDKGPKEHAEGGGCEPEDHAEGGGCNQWDGEASAVTKRTVPDDAVWVALDVDGMTCGGCERRIQANVGDLKGVVAVEASSELSRVRIAFEKGTEDETLARQHIAKLGYKVR